MRQLFGFSNPKKFRRSDDLLIKLLRIPVHHDRVIAKFLADTALIHCPQAPQKSAESDICVVDEPLLGSRLPVQVSRDELLDLKIIIIRIGGEFYEKTNKKNLWYAFLCFLCFSCFFSVSQCCIPCDELLY